MADAQRTIDLIFNGVDKTGAAVDSALNNTGKFASGVSSATQPIADFTTNALKFEAAILTAGAALTGFAIKEAASFESALADLNKVLSDTDPIEQYASLARDLSEEYGISSTEIVQSIANYKQAGFTAEEAGQLTKSGLDAVIAGSVEASSAADLLVASIKGFGTEAGQSATIVDLLNQVSNEYATNFNELLIGFADFSPIAKAVGLSLEETVGILTPGIEVFRSGSEVATALRTSFVRLTGDTKPVAEALASLGVAQRDANGELRSGRDIYFDVAEAFQTLDQNQKLYTAGQLVGANQSARFIAVTEGLDKSLRIAGDGFKFAGSAAKEVEIQLATAEKTFDRVGASLSNLFIDLGTPLLDNFSNLGDAVVNVFRTIADNAQTGGLGDLSQFVEDTFDSLAEDFEEIARNLPAALEQADFSGFTDGLQAIGDGVSNVFGGLDITSVDGLVTAIEALGAGFNGLSQFSAGAIESFRPLFDLVVDLADGVGGAAERFRELGNIGGFAIQVNSIANAASSAIPVLQGLVAIVGINQAVGLAGSVRAAATAISGAGGLVGALGSLSALAAAGGAGFGLGKLADEAVRLATGSGLSDRLSDWLTSFTDLNDQAIELERTIGPSAEQAARDIAALDKEMESVNKRVSEGVDFWGDYGDGSGEVIPVLFDIDDAWNEIQAATNEAASAVTRVVEESEKISLDEKLKLIEAGAAITTAQIQADATKISSAFESVGVTIEATGEAITDLSTLLGDDNISKFDKFDIRDRIEEQAEIQRKAADAQRKILEATAREINARAEAFRNGGSLIQIDGAGLQPHLEAFMFEILESLQVRVNAEGYNLLLGAGA